MLHKPEQQAQFRLNWTREAVMAAFAKSWRRK
jgi:hypothetical protein